MNGYRTSVRMVRFAATVACLAVLAGGCGDGGSGGGGTDRVEAVPFAFTTVLDDASLALLSDVSEDGATLTFTGSTPLIDALAVDRVVVGGPSAKAPLGFLRKVDAVTRDGAKTTVTTSPTAIIYAFRKLKVHVERDLDPASVQGGVSSALSRVESAVTGSKDFQYGVDWLAFDGDGDAKTTEDRVLVQGSLDATVSVTFDIDFEWPDVEDDLKKLLKLDITGVLEDIGFQLKFIATLTAGADLHVVGKAAREFEREFPLAPPLYLGSIWVPPVLFTPRLQALAGIRGGATSEVTLDLAQTGSLEAGVQMNMASVTRVAPHLLARLGGRGHQRHGLRRGVGGAARRGAAVRLRGAVRRDPALPEAGGWRRAGQASRALSPGPRIHQPSPGSFSVGSRAE